MRIRKNLVRKTITAIILAILFVGCGGEMMYESGSGNLRVTLYSVQSDPGGNGAIYKLAICIDNSFSLAMQGSDSGSPYVISGAQGSVQASSSFSFSSPTTPGMYITGTSNADGSFSAVVPREFGETIYLNATVNAAYSISVRYQNSL